MPSALIPNGSGKRDARSWVSNPSLGAMTWLSLRRRLKYLPMYADMATAYDCTKTQNTCVMRRVPRQAPCRNATRCETRSNVGWRAVCHESGKHGSEGGQGFLRVRLSYPTMQWSKEGAHLLLQTRVRTLNGELAGIFKRWYTYCIYRRNLRGGMHLRVR